MDQLPVEILEKIFDEILWDNPGELYRLRAVSRTWKSVADHSGSRVFKYWYNRCKKEIPEDHLADIVQVKYPLLAHPWRECYWVDRGLPQVAKNVYHIWKGFPTFEDGIDHSKVKLNYPFKGLQAKKCTVGINDKYFAISVHDGKNELQETLIYQWDNLQLPIRTFDFISEQIDFYSTGKGTFIVLAHFDKTDTYFNETFGKFKVYISKYPIDRLECSSELILLKCIKKRFHITQNECFIWSSENSTWLEHSILTESGFETNTIIKPPPEMLPQASWCFERLEICGCYLYVLYEKNLRWNIFYEEEVSVVKYKISRNSNGKLSFTLEEYILLTDDEDCNYALYNEINLILSDPIFRSTNLHLIDMAFASAKLNPWLDRTFSSMFYGRVRAEFLHANYVFCTKQPSVLRDHIWIVQKDHLVKCMEPNNRDVLKVVSVRNVGRDAESEDSTIYWISLIYIGLKAHMLVNCDDALCLINFY